MATGLRFDVLVLMLAIGLAASTVHCDCENGQTDCITAADCEERTWQSDCAGHWECRDGLCFEVCDDCQSAADCEDNAWPADAGCAAADGHWECDAGACQAVCDAECSEAADCEANAWPADAGCAAADGHWECDAGACQAVCDAECSEAADCAGNAWPADAGCAAADGYWECDAGSCVAVCPECSTDADCTEHGAACEGNWTDWECLDGQCSPICCEGDFDCLDWLWDEECEGRWRCDRTACVRVCDDPACGDGSCAAAQGEDTTTCPTDCQFTCDADTDCRMATWSLPCGGRWTCPDGVCEPVCDYGVCGDGHCADDEGLACLEDCLEGHCSIDSDCLYQSWNKPCEGHWDCVAGLNNCASTCGGSCGDGVCDPEAGEGGDTCPADCDAGPCPYGVMDCFAIAWDGDLGAPCAGSGRWSCGGPAAAPTCQRVCDPDETHCPDGVCDVPAGESPDSCPDDCADHGCATAGDCAGLELPAGCAGGAWRCYRQVCWPDC